MASEIQRQIQDARSKRVRLLSPTEKAFAELRNELAQLRQTAARKAAFSKRTLVTVLQTASTVIIAPDQRIVSITVTNLDGANPIYINTGRPTNSTTDGHYIGPQQTAFISEALGDDTVDGVTGIAGVASVLAQVTTGFATGGEQQGSVVVG